MRTLASEGCIGGNFVKQQKIKFGRVSELQAFRFSVLKLKNTFQLQESVIWYTFGVNQLKIPWFGSILRILCSVLDLVLEGYLMKSFQTKSKTFQKSSKNTISGVICCELTIHPPPIQVQVEFPFWIIFSESIRVQGVPSKVRKQQIFPQTFQNFKNYQKLLNSLRERLS